VNEVYLALVRKQTQAVSKAWSDAVGFSITTKTKPQTKRPQEEERKLLDILAAWQEQLQQEVRNGS